MKNPWLLAVLAAFLCAAAQSNEFLPWGSGLLAFFSLYPLFLALRNTRSYRQAAWVCGLFGGINTVLENYWLAYFKDYALATIGGVTVGVALLSLLLGPVLRWALTRGPWIRPFLAGAVWAFWEYCRSNGYLGFPWGLIPYPLHDQLAWIQIVSLTGVYGLSWLLAALQAWLAEFQTWRHPRDLPEVQWGRRLGFQGGALGLLVLLVLGFGIWTLIQPLPSSRSLQVSLIQQNVNSWDDGNRMKGLTAAVDLSTEALAQNFKPNLVVWSETSLTTSFQDRFRAQFEFLPPHQPLLPLIRSTGSFWLFGGPWFLGPGEVHNATFLVDPEGQVLDYYGKQHLVPLAEGIPFSNVPAVSNFVAQVLGLGGFWTPGERTTVYHLPTSGGEVKFFTPICFEDAFSSLAREGFLQGADLMINLSNDSWSRKASSENQHHILAKFRAVEARKPLIRSTNAGVTAIIGPHGETLAGPLPYFVPAYLNATIPIPNPGTTFYVWAGDWFALALALWLTGYLLWENRESLPWLRRRKRGL